MLQIGYVVYPGFGILSLGTTSVFQTANKILKERRYDVALLSEHGGPVKSNVGAVVETQRFGSVKPDTVVIGGGGATPYTAGIRNYLRRSALEARRVASTCTGAFFLAEAGLLDGRRATTHQDYTDAFRARFPKVLVQAERLAVIDGKYWTCAGHASGIDQTLALIEQDVGIVKARRIGEALMLPDRHASTAPTSPVPVRLASASRVKEVLAYAQRNLSSIRSVDQLARVADLGPRQLHRLFKEETGLTPGKAIEKLRIEVAHVLVREGDYSIETVAELTGFHDRERMRRVFIRTFGQSPQSIRRAAPRANAS